MRSPAPNSPATAPRPQVTEAVATEVFAGTEPPPPHLQFDAERLKEWIGDRLPGFEGSIRIEKFRGGQSNPTYRIETEGRAYVLRRKPPGPLRPTAHAIDREFRVLKALEGTGTPIPHPHLYCDDADVIGSEFYIVDAVVGPIHWSAELPGVSPEYRADYYEDLFRQLARLHRLDWKRIGLEGFGKETGFSARNLERWYKTYCDTRVIEIQDVDWLAAALRERLPAEEPVSLIHGDYGNHNVIAAPGEPRVAAILDWEISTIGNPFVDLAHAMRPWMEPPEPGKNRPTLADKDLGALGIPTIDQAIDIYQREGGLTWSDPQFYLAFAMFRYACIIQGVLRRYADGTAANRMVAHSQDRVVAIAAKARAVLTSEP
jgi:aminoglycoside phosphotransferase (APT) family kinase protein